MQLTRADCVELDRQDHLAPQRARFILPEGVNYLDGNSLGPVPRGVSERVARVIEDEWGHGLIRSWNSAGWYDASLRIGGKLAPLLGAAPHQVIVADTVSINLFKTLMAAARLRPDRKTIVAELGNFPSDNHMVESVARLLGMTSRFVAATEMSDAVDRNTAVVQLSHINYRTADIQNMTALSAAVHAKGALTVWDLAHSTGAVALQLDQDGADFAVGCGYKFLCGGPGAPSHLYVAERHLQGLDQPLTGWFGHARPFDFREDFVRADGIRAMLCSTPQMLSTAALEAALDALSDLNIRDVQEKGRNLGDVMIRLFEERLAPLGCGLASSRDASQRGNHIALTHPFAYQIMQALIGRGVIGDFRAPDVMRFGFGPLYVRYADIWDAVYALEDILRSGSWRTMPLPVAGAIT
jgi:kynureninase